MSGSFTQAGAVRIGTRAQARRFVIMVALLAMLSLAFAAPAFAKDYSMGPVDIVATVASDGSMMVQETRTFTFEEDFTFVAWQLDKSAGTTIDVLSVAGPEGEYARTDDPGATESRPPASYLVSDFGDSVEVRAFFRYADTSVPFTLTYKVSGAATRWADTSELYWQILGDQSEKSSSDVTIDVMLPNPGEEVVPGENVRAWAHGPLTGEITFPDANTVRFQVDDVAPYTFVEPRIAFPESWLAAAPQDPRPMLQTILDEEAKWADEANAARTRARFLVWGSIIGSALLSLFAIVAGIVLFLRYGKEHDPGFAGEYFREDPGGLHPAIVGSLWRMGAVEDSDVAATLMDLANRGVIHMQPVTESKPGFLGIGSKDEQTYQMQLDRSRLSGVHKLDRELISILFDTIGKGDTVTIEQIKAYAKKRAETFANRMSAWKTSVKDETESLGYFEKTGERARGFAIALGVLAVAGGIGAAVVSRTFLIAVLGVGAGIVDFALAAFMSRRSREANELYAKYRGVRNYLRDFSRLNEAPPTHVKLWEHFLVLAVVFGVAREVIEQLRVRIPEVVADPAFQSTYWWVYSTSGRYNDSPVGALQSGFTSAASIASSQMSSSSGGGGGFSGGGGGGGGGGGVSAG